MTNPIERVEILRQVENVDFKGLKLSTSIKKLYESQGISGLLKGNTASVTRVFPYSAIEFYALEVSKNYFTRGTQLKLSFLYNFACGAFAGLAAISISHPLDVARTRISINTQNSLLKENKILVTLMNLWKTDGVFGIYKGYSVASVGAVFYIAIKQSSFEFFKARFIKESKYKIYLNLLYGSLAGTIGTLIMYPFYMIKRVLQANSKFIALYLDKERISIKSHLKDLLSRYGIRGFYLGLSMTLLKTAPYVGITFLCNEKLKEMFKY